MQKHNAQGQPLCGACPEPVLPGQTYLVIHQRDKLDVGGDSSVMVHSEHFASTQPKVSSSPIELQS